MYCDTPSKNDCENLSTVALFSILHLYPESVDEKKSSSENIHKFLKTLRPQQINAFKELAIRFSEKPLPIGTPFNCSKDLYDRYHLRLREEKKEHFIIVIVDNKHQYLAEKIISIGTLNKSLVHPRECLKPVIEFSGAAFVTLHNHPSGDPCASQEDIGITTRLKESGKILGLPLLDHLIFGNNRYYSFADEGLL